MASADNRHSVEYKSTLITIYIRYVFRVIYVYIYACIYLWTYMFYVCLGHDAIFVYLFREETVFEDLARHLSSKDQVN